MVLDIGVSREKFVVIEVTSPPHVTPVDLPGIGDKVRVEDLYARETPLFSYSVNGELRLYDLY